MTQRSLRQLEDRETAGGQDEKEEEQDSAGLTMKNRRKNIKYDLKTEGGRALKQIKSIIPQGDFWDNWLFSSLRTSGTTAEGYCGIVQCRTVTFPKKIKISFHQKDSGLFLFLYLLIESFPHVWTTIPGLLLVVHPLCLHRTG